MENEKEPKFERLKYGERGQGALTKMAGSPYWYSIIWFKGREHCRSLITDNLAEAKKRHQELLDERAAAKHGASGSSARVSSAPPLMNCSISCSTTMSCGRRSRCRTSARTSRG